MKTHTRGKMSICEQIKVFISINLKLWKARSRAKRIDILMEQLRKLENAEKALKDSI